MLNSSEGTPDTDPLYYRGLVYGPKAPAYANENGIIPMQVIDGSWQSAPAHTPRIIEATPAFHAEPVESLSDIPTLRPSSPVTPTEVYTPIPEGRALVPLLPVVAQSTVAPTAHEAGNEIPSRPAASEQASRWVRAVTLAAAPLVRASVYLDARVARSLSSFANRRQRLLTDTQQDRTAVMQAITNTGNSIAHVATHTARVLEQPLGATKVSWNTYRNGAPGVEKAQAADRLARDLGTLAVTAVQHFYNNAGTYAGAIRANLQPAGQAAQNIAGRARQDVAELSAPVRQLGTRARAVTRSAASKATRYAKRSIKPRSSHK